MDEKNWIGRSKNICEHFIAYIRNKMSKLEITV